jgi:hypothetical protein
MLRGRYCSSDFWSGDVAASDATFGYAFRGARIVAATITDLLENKGMGAQPDAQLLFGGCSAGAIGAMNNVRGPAVMAAAARLHVLTSFLPFRRWTASLRSCRPTWPSRASWTLLRC